MADMQKNLADAGDDKSLEEELQSCRLLLVDSEIKKRDIAFKFVVNNLAAQVIEEKLDCVLENLKCAAKLNLALGFLLKKIEVGKFRYFFGNENNTRLEQSKLASNKDGIARMKDVLMETDVIESCTKEMSKTKRKFSN